MNRATHPILCLLALLLMAACNTESSKAPVRSAYYWSTTFALDSMQREWMSKEGVRRMYVRYFDVVESIDGTVMPNATINFQDSVPEGVEVVPCVFVTNEAMAHAPAHLDSLIYQRVKQMSATHDIKRVKTIQIDCDWSQRTRTAYFAMLEGIRNRAHADGLQLSVTIRLHQLSQSVPPADAGVLMVYNTGDVRNMERDPILSAEDVRPYLRHLSGYNLPLSAAYPAFAWDIQYRRGQYIEIRHIDDEMRLMPGDTLVHRAPSVETVLQVKHIIDAERSDVHGEIILFDISKNNIQRITKHHYEKVYTD